MAVSVAIGNLEIQVAENELEALAIFTPDPKGAEWSAEKLSHRFMDSRLAGISPARVNALFHAFAHAKTTVHEVLLKGTAPESVCPELCEYGEHQVPAELEPWQEAVLAQAGAPKLERVRIENVAVERTVLKPSPLPFLPGKEQKIVEQVKKEIREAVDIDLSVESVGFVKQGDRIGVVSPPRPGKPGKTIFGKPLPAPELHDKELFLGSGVARDKNALVALGDGFLRMGKRWLDIVPFAVHTWEVKASADGSKILLDFRPGFKQLPAPDAGAIHAKAAEINTGADDLLSSDEIARIIQDSIKTGKELCGVILSADSDGIIETAVDPDKNKATLTIRKARGHGKTVEAVAVGAAISALKLARLDAARVRKDLLAFLKGTDKELEAYILSQGRASVPGKDRTLTTKADFVLEADAKSLVVAFSQYKDSRKLAPSLPEWAVTDGVLCARVKATQELARFSPPDPGQAGYDVFGTAVPATPGKAPDIKLYESVSRAGDVINSRADGVLFYSAEEGVHRFRVLPCKDAQIRVELAKDGMQAFLSLEPEIGFGTPLTMEACMNALKEADVAFGLDTKAVSDAVEAARGGKPVSKVVAAVGQAAVPSGGYRLEWIVNLASGAAVSLRKDGSADFRNQDRFTSVEANAPLLVLARMGDAGRDGMLVNGMPVKAGSDPNTVPLPSWDNSIREEIIEGDKKRLVAAVAGKLSFESNKLSIVQVHPIKGDVGPTSGNVRFAGAVQISGAVLAGYTVFSGGDIVIAGAVEASLVSSDGNVRIGEGIKGAHRGTIRAKGFIEAAFAEQATLMAVGDIRIKTACMLCNVKANGRLAISGDRGSFIGGHVRARKGIDVFNLGSENNAKTAVSFGQDYLVADQIEAEEREIAAVKERILQIDRSMREQEAEGLNTVAARTEKMKLLKLLEKRTLRAFGLREKFEEHFPAEIRIRGTVFPGVIIESHSRILEIRTKKEKVVFSFDPSLGRIVEHALK